MKIGIIQWCVVYFILWCLLSYFLTPLISYDAVEALNWGRNQEWGSPKNPWLVGVMMWPAIYYPEIHFVLYWYAIHFFCISIGIAGVWFLTKEISGKSRNAWFAVMSLNLSGAINIDAIEFNDNYLLIMLWPWVLFLFVKSVYYSKSWWIVFFVVSTLAAMAKYSTFSLFIMMIILAFFNSDVRKSILNKYFLIGLSFFVLFCLPNLLWNINHGFAAFQWVSSQVTRKVNNFCFQVYLSVFYPVIILVLLFRLFKIKSDKPIKSSQVLNLVVIPPVLIIFIWFSFNHSDALYEWIQPFLIISIPLLLARAKITCFFNEIMMLVFFIAFLFFISYFFIQKDKGLSYHTDGVIELTAQVEKDWNSLFGTRLFYVGGSKLSQWMTIYAKYKPQIITPWSLKLKPNVYSNKISQVDIMKNGAVIFGEPGEYCNQYSNKEKKNYIFFDSSTNTNVNVCVFFMRPHSTDYSDFKNYILRKNYPSSL